MNAVVGTGSEGDGKEEEGDDVDNKKNHGLANSPNKHSRCQRAKQIRVAAHGD